MKQRVELRGLTSRALVAGCRLVGGGRSFLLLLLAATVLLALAVPNTGFAQPSLQMPFDVGQCWGPTTYKDHRVWAKTNQFCGIDWWYAKVWNRDLWTAGESAGKNVRAMHAGKVIRARSLNQYGPTVVIKHPTSYGGYYYYTLYAHLAGIIVREGAIVEPGQKLGVVGAQGHLHWELLKGKKDDGTDWVPQNVSSVVIDGQKVGLAKTNRGHALTSVGLLLPYSPDNKTDVTIRNTGDYRQTDNRWGGIRLGEKKNCPTIANSGCAMTSSDDVLIRWGIKWRNDRWQSQDYFPRCTNPRDLNEWLGANQGYSNCGIIWGKVADYSAVGWNKVDFRVSHNFSTPVKAKDCRPLNRLLNARVPVIVKVGPPEHWVVVYGRKYEKKGNAEYWTYYIRDPASSSRDTLAYYKDNIYAVRGFAPGKWSIP